MRDAALRAISDAQTAARKASGGAKLLCSAFARWARGSEAGAFVFWRGVTRTVLLIEDARTRAARRDYLARFLTTVGLEVASMRVCLLEIDDV